MISFDHVTVTHELTEGTLTALDGISVTLSEPRVALIGPNGSGKSTLARLVNGLVTPSTGSVTVDGIDVASRPRQVRDRVGFVFTDPAAQLIMPTVREDIELSLRRQEKNRSHRRTKAEQILATHGLEPLADRSVHALSGGQRQLVALAGVLAADPRIVVADEPTTLLDLANARLIGDLLTGLDQQLILATHDLELAARCDRVLLIRDGHIADDGPPDEVIAGYRANP